MSRQVTATAADVTLFDVAGLELGDPLAWWQIAQATGISDPWLPALVSVLTVPTVVAPANDGNPP